METKNTKKTKYLSIKQTASKYGQEIHCKWCSPDGSEWIDKTMIVNGNLICEMEKGTIKDCY